MKLALSYYGAPILRKKAKPIESITQETRDIVEAMAKMMEEKNGVGLAAPQVGLPYRIFILRVEIEDEEGNFTFGPLEVYINPTISEPSELLTPFSEGCLSIPGIRGEVFRPQKITIEALDLEGRPFKKECDGLRARIIMHENDHLNGILFIDRLPKKERNALEPRLRAIKKKYSHY